MKCWELRQSTKTSVAHPVFGNCYCLPRHQSLWLLKLWPTVLAVTLRSWKVATCCLWKGVQFSEHPWKCQTLCSDYKIKVIKTSLCVGKRWNCWAAIWNILLGQPANIQARQSAMQSPVHEGANSTTEHPNRDALEAPIQPNSWTHSQSLISKRTSRAWRKWDTALKTY